MNAQHTPDFIRGRVVQAASAVALLTHAFNRTYDLASDAEVARCNQALLYVIEEFNVALQNAKLRKFEEPFESIDEAVELAKAVVYAGLGYIPEV